MSKKKVPTKAEPAKAATPTEAAPPAHSERFKAVVHTYVSENRLSPEFVNEALSAFPSDAPFDGMRIAVMEALTPGDRANMHPKSIDWLALMFGVAMRRTATQSANAAVKRYVEDQGKVNAAKVPANVN